MKKERFKDIFWFAPKSKVKAGEGLDKGRFPFYTSSQNLSKWIDTEQYFDEALIFGTGGSASMHYVDEPFSTSTDCIVTINRKVDIKTKFVYYYLLSNIHILEEGFKGAGLKHISKAYIEQIEIPIPDIEFQNKVIALLDKAQTALEKRLKTIILFDELLNSSFLKMFGDPFFNPKRFPIDILENKCSFITKGTTPKNIDILDKPFEGCIPFLKVYHITDWGIDSHYKPSYVSSSIHNKDLSRSKVKPNDVLMNIVGPPLGKIGLVPDTFEEWNINQAIVIFRTKQELLPVYLLNALKSKTLLSSIIEQAVGVRQQNLSLKQCREIKIPIPPIQLQKEFERLFHLNRKCKEKLILSKYHLEQLIYSLSNSAFDGSLDFNTAVDLEVLLENDYKFFQENSNAKSIQLLLERLDKDELNEKKFSDQEIYDKAKGFAFELLKEGKVKQVFDVKTKRVKLTV